MVPRDPVFIVGGARSGTTFLAKLIDSHPDVLYRHEPDSVLGSERLPFVPRPEEIEGLLPLAGEYLDALCHVRATKVSGQRPVFDKSYRSGLQKKRFLAGLYLAKIAERAGQRFGYKHVEIPDCLNQSARDRILYLIKSVDTPWRTLLYSRARPAWRFIHILRHPCAAISSKIKGIERNLMTADTFLRPPFEAGMAANYPFTLDEIESCSYEERIAFLWMICNQWIHDEMADHPGYQLVVYEDLCQDLTATTRRLFDFIGLSFDAQSQDFLAQLEATEAGDAHYFDVVRSPKASLYKWREQLSADQIERIERMVCHSAIGRRFFGRE